MATITDFNVSPYYDDFADSNNYHRVLFRPSYALQARELTQARLKHVCPLVAFQFHEKMFAHGETYLKENVEEL